MGNNGHAVTTALPIHDPDRVLVELVVAAARADDPRLYIAVARLNHLQGTVTLAFTYAAIRHALGLPETR